MKQTEVSWTDLLQLAMVSMILGELSGITFFWAMGITMFVAVMGLMLFLAVVLLVDLFMWHGPLRGPYPSFGKDKLST